MPDRTPVLALRSVAGRWFAIGVTWLLPRIFFRLRLERRENLPAGACVLCFNHLNWIDPIVLLGALPTRPRLYFFGPKEEDMAVGGRNRLMGWSGTPVPYRPGNRGLVEAAHRVRDLLVTGSVLAVAGEGRIHAGERIVPPLQDGAAFFALRNHVPLIPVSINGTGWLAFGRTVRVRIGEPIDTAAFEGADAVARLSAATRAGLEALVADFPDRPPPGRFGRWLTEVFNDWPEGERPAVPPDRPPDPGPDVGAGD